MFASLAPWLQRLAFEWAWLWLLLPAPLLLHLLPAGARTHGHSVRVPNLPNLLGPEPAASAPSGRDRLLLAAFAALWLCLLCAATRPQLLMPASYREVPVRDLLLVLDVSASMATEDMQDEAGAKVSRMAALQRAVRSFIQARPDDNIGLIVFGSQAYPFAPLSRDHRVLLERVDELRPAMAGPQTSIGDALGSTLKMFRQLDAGGQDRERMVVLLTDGKDTSSTLPPEVALRLARKEHLRIHTIGLGEEGDDSSDLPLLRRIASETGGTFQLAGQSARSLQEVYATLDRINPRKLRQLGWSYRLPLYRYPLLAALGALALIALRLRGKRGGHA
ncbi:VWA domain-containing protein [Pseudomonas citronellolis]|uniref:VWA domain-containing protein n=1 Tax=Pseudomonas citronellolis TaxID=53408 RepID=UPI0023E43BA1|nr:VWA domain-containing protein [Pseudomonas citronellolis]MDF3935574.1 VWA domain-containing protein [Pseudomonas citronellolis]